MIKNVAIIGMGALGIMYGGNFMNALGSENVNYIAEKDRYDKYVNEEFTLNGKKLDMHFVLADEAKPYDLVMVAVKFPALPAAIKTMRNCVGENTIIMSVMNGIDSENIIAETFGRKNLVYSVPQGMDCMRSGHEVSYVNEGIVFMGDGKNELPFEKEFDKAAILKDLDELWTKSKLNHEIVDNIMYRMWTKWGINVGINQVCAAYQCDYTTVVNTPEMKDRFFGAQDEVMALSKAEGINLGDDTPAHNFNVIVNMNPTSIPSMEQDRRAGRKTEVDMFAGTVIRLGKKHGIPTPTNDWLYARIKELEKDF